MSVMKKVEKQKLQRLIRQSLRSLCEAGLPESTNISIEGLIGITVNSDYVVLVNIQEEIGDGDSDMLECPMHEETSHVERHGRGKGPASFHGHGPGMNMRMRQHMLRRHMMHAMHAHMATSSAGSARGGGGHNITTQHQGGQYPKRSSPQRSKASKHNFDFDSYDVEDDELTPQVPQSFNMASTSPCKSIPASSNQDGKDGFSFINYDREIFQPENAQSQTDTHETSATETAPKTSMSAKPLTADEVQASTICITPVVDSPKSDEPAQSSDTSTSVAEMTNQMSALSDFGRKIGTLMAVKQEGASMRRGAKIHNQTHSSPQVEEISDSDNTLQGDERTTTDQDPVMSGGPDRDSPIPDSDVHQMNEDAASKTLGAPDEPSSANDTINIDMDMLSQMDADDHPHDFVDLDHSFLQILPEVVEKHSDMIHDFIEIEGDEVKGEPRENKEQESREDSKEVDQEEEGKTSDKKDTIRKKISTKLQAGEQGEDFEDSPENFRSALEDGDQIPEDYEEVVDSFVPPGLPFPPGPPPFMGRGFGHRGHFCGRRGGMFGRGGFFGRGGPMMAFAGHPFYRIGDGEKKLLRCKICGSCFINKANYETHMLKHENKGQGSAGLSDGVGTSCPYCKKRFRYKSWLEQHITTHTKEKLFRCPYCSKAYTRRRNVHKHIEMFHPEILGPHGQGMDEGLNLQESVNPDT